MTKTMWETDIAVALRNLGGSAHLEKLYEEVKRIRRPPLPQSWKATIRRTIEDHAPESDGFKGNAMFYSVGGKGKGVWSLHPESNASENTENVPMSNKNDENIHRNHAWSRDELILALDLYLQHRASPPSKDSKEIAELSKFLNVMGTVLGRSTTETFRNTNGVYMKLMNFRRFDTEYTSGGKVGLTRGNKDEEVVWAEFAGDMAHLQRVVSAIRLAVESNQAGALGGIDEPDIVEAEEGRVLTRLHRIRERSRTLVEQCKKAALKKHGRLACEACGFDFSVKYGDVGNGIIEVHHTRPVHTLTEGEKTKLDDLALLCANCHRVVHSRRRWLTVDEVKAAIRK